MDLAINSNTILPMLRCRPAPPLISELDWRRRLFSRPLTANQEFDKIA